MTKLLMLNAEGNLAEQEYDLYGPQIQMAGRVGAKYYNPGLYYDTFWPMGRNLAGSPAPSGSVFAWPFFVQEDSTFNQLGFNIVTAGNGEIYAGIYDSLPSGAPGNLLFATPSPANNGATAGTQVFTMNLVFKKGQVIWLAVKYDPAAITPSAPQWSIQSVANDRTRSFSGGATVTGATLSAYRKNQAAAGMPVDFTGGFVSGGLAPVLISMRAA